MEEENKSRFVKPKLEKPKVIFQNDSIRIVKRRTQIPTGEWNKELIIEALAGRDALGEERWLEVTAAYVQKHIYRRHIHAMDWHLLKTVASIICEEESKDDYDYIFYINRGRYRVKGEIKNGLE